MRRIFGEIGRRRGQKKMMMDRVKMERVDDNKKGGETKNLLCFYIYVVFAFYPKVS